MARLFVGTFLQATERDQVAELPAQCPQLSQLVNRKIRWVKPKKLHMTWIFLGEVREDVTDVVSQTLEKSIGDFRRAGENAKQAGAAAGEPGETDSPLEIQFDKLAFWPSKKEPKHVVLCASQPSPHFTLLASTIRRDLKPFCDSDKEEKFRPHVTLLRLDRHPLEPSAGVSATALAQFTEVVADAASQVSPLQLSLDRIDLIRSHIGQSSEEYESLNSFATTGF